MRILVYKVEAPEGTAFNNYDALNGNWFKPERYTGGPTAWHYKERRLVKMIHDTLRIFSGYTVVALMMPRLGVPTISEKDTDNYTYRYDLRMHGRKGFVRIGFHKNHPNAIAQITKDLSMDTRIKIFEALMYDVFHGTIPNTGFSIVCTDGRFAFDKHALFASGYYGIDRAVLETDHYGSKRQIEVDREAAAKSDIPF